MSESGLQKTIDLSGQWPAVAEVADATDLSKEVIQEAAEKGAVWLRAAQGASQYKKPCRVRSLDNRFKARDQILINYDREVLLAVPPSVEMISDQVNYSVWYKPPAVLSQGTKWGDHCSLCYLVEKKHGKPAMLVHRLDRAASGLMVVAHTKNALIKLTALFADRLVDKTYHARVHGIFKEKLPQKITTPVAEKSAVTTITHAQDVSNKENEGESLLSVNIETGRKHQIRSHLSSVGFPVVGDRLFDPQREHKRDLQLVSVELGLQCPFTSKRVSVQLPERLNTVKS